MTKEEELLKRRFIDLADKAYSQTQYTYTTFLNTAEVGLFYQILHEIKFAPYKLFGGSNDCERQMLQFGSEEIFGYAGVFPIQCILIKPLIAKFADEFTHRDFLGALLNLGIQRNTIGDIIIRNNEGYVYCTDIIADFIMMHLEKVKHTHVQCIKADDKPNIETAYESARVTVSSARIDLVTAKIYNLSRSQSMELFRTKKVFLNSKIIENNSYLLKKEDIISIRGYGKWVYDGIEYETKKGKFCVIIRKYR